MTKVYIVTSGSYSDYSIERVFLDKEKAEKYIKLCDNNWSDPQLEEYDTDDNETINEIAYVDGVYFKNQPSYFSGKEIDVSIKRSNSLDDEEKRMKASWFNKSHTGGYSLRIKRVLHGDFDEDRIVKKYEKVLYDLMTQVEYLMSTGWDEKMIREWFVQKSDEYIEGQ